MKRATNIIEKIIERDEKDSVFLDEEHDETVTFNYDQLCKSESNTEVDLKYEAGIFLKNNPEVDQNKILVIYYLKSKKFTIGIPVVCFGYNTIYLEQFEGLNNISWTGINSNTHNKLTNKIKKTTLNNIIGVKTMLRSLYP